MAEELKFKKKEKEDDIKVNPEIERRLKIIARNVGNDFNMRVEIIPAGQRPKGDPEEGTYTVPDENRVVFDPAHINKEEEIQEAEFFAAHEGAHRAVDRGPNQIGLKKEEADKIFSQIGFSYIMNVLADPAANDWLKGKFNDFIPRINKLYDSIFSKENIVIGLDQRDAAMAVKLLRRIPKFVQYGSELERKWHKGNYSQKLDEDVAKALAQTEKAVLEHRQNIPSVAILREDDVIQKARERFLIAYDEIWPEVKKIVEEDLKTESLAQMLKQEAQMCAQCGGGGGEGEGEETHGQEGGEGSKGEGGEDVSEIAAQKEGKRGGSGETGQKCLMDKLPDDLKNELKQKLQKANQKKNNGKESEESGDSEEKTKQGKVGGKEEHKDSGVDSDSGGQSEERKDTKKDGRQEMGRDSKDDGDSDVPISIGEFSEELKGKLQEIFDAMENEKKKELREKAEEEFKKIEDSLNESLRGKLNEDNLESHKERNERIKRELEEKEKKISEKEEMEHSRREFEKKLQINLSEYDRTCKEMKNVINDLYKRFLKIFIPERHPRWKAGYPMGGRISTVKAMQYEADSSKYSEIWEKKTLPSKFDYRFVLLNDISSSMKGGGIMEDFRAKVVIAEVLNRFGIKFEIIGYNTDIDNPNYSYIYKDFKEKLDKKTREKLGSIKKMVGGNTPTVPATKFASERLELNKGKHNFIITLTDGEANTEGDSTDVKYLTRLLSKEKKQKFIGLGLGTDTDFVRNTYPFAIPNIPINRLSFVLADLFEELIKNPEKY